MHPKHGYYTTRNPFGAAGDFITAPEISQMFGEMLGLTIAQVWRDQGAPDPFTLAELGPGRGTLMADVVRATAKVPGFHQAMRVCLVERSPSLQSVQRQALHGIAVRWLDEVDGLPDAPLFLLANEFFDALPIRQFTRMPDGWAETLVGLAGDKLILGKSAPAYLAQLAHRIADTTAGDIVETCPAANAIMGTIAAKIVAHGGCAIIIDYGEWGSKGDTFQAVQHHAFVNPLAAPGLADLTAHVDFAALATAASAIRPSFSTQGDFLSQVGIFARSERLAKGLTGDALASHAAALDRLTSPSEMGQLFKVLALVQAGHPPVPGFA